MTRHFEHKSDPLRSRLAVKSAECATEPGATVACGKLLPETVEKYLLEGQPPDATTCAKCDRILKRRGVEPIGWVRFGVATASGMAYRRWSLWHGRVGK